MLTMFATFLTIIVTTLAQKSTLRTTEGRINHHSVSQVGTINANQVAEVGYFLVSAAGGCAGKNQICTYNKAPCSTANDNTACAILCTAETSCVSYELGPNGECQMSTDCLQGSPDSNDPSYEDDDDGWFLYVKDTAIEEDMVHLCQSHTVTWSAADPLPSGSESGVCPHQSQGECYDFSQLSAGTFVDTGHALTNVFANGEVQITVQTEASGTYDGAMVVIREGMYPQDYMSDMGLVNGCLEEASGKNAAVAFLHSDPQYWDANIEERMRLAETFRKLRFTFPKKLVDYFRMSMLDFGDDNAFDVTDVKIHLQAFDSGDNMIVARTYSIENSEWSTPPDGCSDMRHLEIRAETADIKYVELSFTSSDPSVYLPDPEIAISEVCFPGLDTQRGTGIDDPHITGFDGSQFEFRGQAGAVFNLISDEKFQLNCRLVESPVDSKTYMGAMGILTPDAQIYIDPWKTLVNGHPIAGHAFELEHGGHVIPSQNHTTVVTQGWTVQLSVIHWHHGMVHINFDVAINSRFIYNPHGVLGQTAQFLVKGTAPSPKFAGWENQQAVGIIEGSAEDYMLSDGIFGHRFTFNSFGVKGVHHANTRHAPRLIVAKAFDDAAK